MSDAVLRTRIIRLAHDHPEFRKDLIPLLKKAEAASNGGFPPSEIGAEKPGGSAEGVNGKGTVSDAKKPWMANEFTQQENVELAEKQEKGLLGDGKADDAPMKVAKIRAAVKSAKSAKEASELAYRAAVSLGETPKVAVEVARKAYRSFKG